MDASNKFQDLLSGSGRPGKASDVVNQSHTLRTRGADARSSGLKIGKLKIQK